MTVIQTPAEPHPDLADAIVRAERRRDRSERLTEMGMGLAEQIAREATSAPAGEEGRYEPARAFAAVSRAVRMTIGLEARMDAQVIAMRNGEMPSPGRTRRSGPAREVEAIEAGASGCEAGAGTRSSAHRVRVRDAVWEAIYRDVKTITAAQRVLDRLDAGLFDSEDFDDALYRPWREAVAAICADLGLEPDWSFWSDDIGFSRDPSRNRIIWSQLCQPRRPGADPPRAT